MKISEEYIMREIAGEVIIIPTGKAAQYFNGLIATNAVSAFIWKNLEKCETPEQIVQLVVESFEIDEEQARIDIYRFLEDLKKAGMIEY